MEQSFFVINESDSIIYKIKNSKFYAFSFFVEKEEDIKPLLTKLRSEHPSANHYCYAWCIGTKNRISRSSDDGEPTNTAGKPILSQIQSNGLTNCLIVVVRYFGGTLLGTNGLINAYKNSAIEVIQKSGSREIFITNNYQIEFDFDNLSKVMRTLKQLEAKILSNGFKEQHQIIFQIKNNNAAQLIEILKQNYKVKLTQI